MSASVITSQREAKKRSYRNVRVVNEMSDKGIAPPNSFLPKSLRTSGQKLAKYSCLERKVSHGLEHIPRRNDIWNGATEFIVGQVPGAQVSARDDMLL